MEYDSRALERTDNPAALIVLAAQERERLRPSGERVTAQLSLIRKLYERGYRREQIVGLFEFIDWVVQLNAVEDEQFWDGVKSIEEEKRMPYVTTGERIGIERGLQRGLQQGLQQGSLEEARTMVLEILEELFGQPSATLVAAIQQIEDRASLHQLVRRTLHCASVEEFQQTLDALQAQA